MPSHRRSLQATLGSKYFLMANFEQHGNRVAESLVVSRTGQWPRSSEPDLGHDDRARAMPSRWPSTCSAPYIINGVKVSLRPLDHGATANRKLDTRAGKRLAQRQPEALMTELDRDSEPSTLGDPSSGTRHIPGYRVDEGRTAYPAVWTS